MNAPFEPTLGIATRMRDTSIARQPTTARLNGCSSYTPIARLVAPLTTVVGPPAMVGAMVDTLSSAGVAEESILTEEFYGY